MCLRSTDRNRRTKRDDHTEYWTYSTVAPREAGRLSRIIAFVLHCVTIALPCQTLTHTAVHDGASLRHSQQTPFGGQRDRNGRKARASGERLLKGRSGTDGEERLVRQTQH